MAIEIERKFLVQDTGFLTGHQGTELKQGYLTKGPVTVRIRQAGEKGFITVKGLAQGISRTEYEYEIPVADAQAMLIQLCRHPIIEKTRYLINHRAHTWEVDVFHGLNRGLVIAEIELESPDESVDLPSWIAREVSNDSRYFNASLTQQPYTLWDDNTNEAP